MVLYPAIDIRGGKCVRLLKGDFSQETIFSDSPAAMARKWQAQGAEYLHLVDLDGARAGEPQNLAAVREIISSVSVPLELGGGIREIRTIEKVLALGVSRVILGSVAVRKPELVREACGRFGEQVVVGIDAKDGMVAVAGWAETSEITATELAVKMAAAGVRTVIYTDIGRDGTLAGVNVEATAALARVSGLSVVASGGVRDLDDIRALKVHEADGISGAILGKSLYMETLKLPEALAIA